MAPLSKRPILLVEDEPILRSSMARGLARSAAYDVVEAGSVRDALDALGSLTPALLLCDLDLPDGSGIEVAVALEQRGIRIPIVFISAFVGKYRSELARRSDVEIHEKPLPLEKLRAIVSGHLDARIEPTPFGIADYVQLASMGRRSVVLEVEALMGKGRIVIEEGEVRSSFDNLGTGMESFRRLAFLKVAKVACRTLQPGEAIEHNIGGSCEGILLEAARLEDEEAAGRTARRTSEPEMQAVFESWDSFEGAPTSGEDLPKQELDETPGPGPSIFNRLYDDAIVALLAKDYPNALASFRAAAELAPEDPRIVANLERLRAMGFE